MLKLKLSAYDFKAYPLLCRPTVGHQNHHHACTSHALLLHTVTHTMISISATSIKRPSTTECLQSIQLKWDVLNQYNLTLLAIELDHTTTIDLKLDWRDVRTVISLLSTSFQQMDANEIGNFIFTHQYKWLCESYPVANIKIDFMWVSSSKKYVNNIYKISAKR